MNKEEFSLTFKQTEAFDLLRSPENADVMYGGAKGGGKSHFLCLWAFYWANHLSKLFRLKSSDNPLLVGFLGRKQSVDFNHTTLETWKRVIPPECYYIRTQEKEIIINDMVKIWFGGLDRQETMNKFNSAELAFFGIDQAEETERKDISVLEGALRLKCNDIKPPYKTLYTANPAECWLKERFILGKKGSTEHYIPALYTDNPYLPEDYEAQLNKAFSYDPERLRAYKFGDWDVLAADRTVIPTSLIEAMRDKTIIRDKDRFLLALDPALGGDECVAKMFNNGKEIDMQIWHYRDVDKVVQSCIRFCQDYNCTNIAIDMIGFRGIESAFDNDKYDIIPIVSSEASSDIECVNKRDEMWWYARKKFMDQEIEYPEDEETRRQLSSVKFNIMNGRIKLELKDQVKKRIGRSPDRADAFVYGIWAMKYYKDHEEAPRRFFRTGQNDPEVQGAVNKFGWDN